jgi:hypothetical protein
MPLPFGYEKKQKENHNGEAQKRYRWAHTYGSRWIHENSGIYS